MTTPSSNPMKKLILKTRVRKVPSGILSALLILTVSHLLNAANGTWTGGGGNGTWEVSSNWSGGVPGATSGTTNTDVATFDGTTQTTVTNDANRNLGGITFTGSSVAAYTIGTTGGNALSLSSGGAITTVSSTSNVKQTVNAPLILEGASSSSDGSYTFNANSAAQNSRILSIGGTVSGGTTTGKIVLTLTGQQTALNEVSGVISNGNASGGLSIVKSGNGVWRLSGSNTFSGGVTLNAGTLNLGHDNALGSGTFTVANGTITSNRTIGNSVTLDGNTTFTNSSGLNLQGAISLGSAADATRDIAVGAGTVTLSGVISDGSVGKGLSKSGAQILALSGSNNFSGGVSVTAGTLTVSHNNALGSGTLTLGNGTTLTATGRTLANALTLDGNVTFTSPSNLEIQGAVSLGSASGTSRAVTINSGTMTLSGVIADGSSGNALEFGSSSSAVTVNLTADNTFTGGLTIKSGGSGTTVNIGNGGLTGTLGSGDVVNNGVLGFNRAGSYTANNDITGTGLITKSGSGLVTLGGTNSYTGTTTVGTAGGTLQFAKTSALYSAMEASWTKTNIIVNNDATLAVNVGGSGEFSIAQVGTLLTNLTTSITNNGLRAGSTFGIDTTNASGVVTYTSAIANSTGTGAGALGLAKLGTGVLELTANSSSYTGGTTIHTGTLLVNNTAGSATGSGAVTIKSGGALGGAGIVSGAVTVESGATLTPGNSPGALTEGATTLNGGGNYNWQVYDAGGTAGTGFDTINLTSGSVLTIASTSGNTFNINLWSLSGVGPDVNGNAINFNNASDYTWTLFATDQTISGFSADKFSVNVGAVNGTSGFSNALGGGTFSVELADTNTDLVLKFTAVPEPNAVALLLGGIGTVLLFRRRRA